MRLVVKPTAGGPAHDVEAQPADTVAELKAKLSPASGIAAAEQRLVWKGQILKDERSLESYGGAGGRPAVGTAVAAPAAHPCVALAMARAARPRTRPLPRPPCLCHQASPTATRSTSCAASRRRAAPAGAHGCGRRGTGSEGGPMCPHPCVCSHVGRACALTGCTPPRLSLALQRRRQLVPRGRVVLSGADDTRGASCRRLLHPAAA